MNQTDLITFQQAVLLARAGSRHEAYQQLKDLELNYPQNVNLLLWIAYTSPTLRESKKCVMLAATLDPHNPDVAHARDWLEQQTGTLSGPLDQQLPSPAVSTALSNPANIMSQLYNQPQMPLAQYNNQYATQPQAASYAVEVKPTKKSRGWVLYLIPIIFLALLGALLFNVFATKNSFPNNTYTKYSTSGEMYRNAGVGQNVMFFGKLEPYAEYEGFGFVYFYWSDVTLTAQQRQPKLVVRFPKDSKDSPAIGNATYYVKVTDRQANFLVADIIGIEK